jgi:hypothetical protein
MIYIVDGHNLIPKIPGLTLGQLDDEDQLIEILQEYARLTRSCIEVYFDKAVPGFGGKKKVGMIKVQYVSEKTTADEVIIRRVQTAGKRSAELTVISSDQHVLQQIRSLGAKSLSSDQFSKEIRRTFQDPPVFHKKTRALPLERPLSEHEVSEWLEMFNSGPSEKYSE